MVKTTDPHYWNSFELFTQTFEIQPIHRNIPLPVASRLLMELYSSHLKGFLVKMGTDNAIIGRA